MSCTSVFARGYPQMPPDSFPPLRRQVREPRAARQVALLLAGQISADYIRAVPTIDLPDDELAAVTAAIRRAIDA